MSFKKIIKGSGNKYKLQELQKTTLSFLFNTVKQNMHLFRENNFNNR